MGYWGWRPLMIYVFISVWVAGCNIITDASPSISPTPTPLVTLTVRPLLSATPRGTPASIAERITPFPQSLTATLTNSLTSTHFAITPTLTYPPPSLSLPPPTCYETPADSILCLGLVDNTLDQPLEQVIIQVQLVRGDGTPIDAAITGVEQAIIPPGISAPYRALFQGTTQSFVGASASLQRGDWARNVDTRFVTLDIQDESGEMVDGRYVVAAVLSNSYAQDAQTLRVVVTLLDDMRRVVGYRVVPVADRLAAGESLPIHVEIVPQQAFPVRTHLLYVEARQTESTSSPR